MGNGALFLIAIGAFSAFVAGIGMLVLAYRTPPHRSKATGPQRAQFVLRRVLGQRRKLILTLSAAMVVGLASGWPVAAVAGGLGMWFAPVLLGSDAEDGLRTARIEAVAVWTEMLRDTLSAAAGLEQAVLASTTVAPEAIAGPLATLGSDLRSRRPFHEAMHTLATMLADPTADQVVASLVYAQRNQVKNLAELLGELAAAARAQVTLAVRVQAERGKHRTSQRVVTIIFSAMAVGLTVAYPRFLQPYDTAAGQLVMAVVLAMFAGGLAWMRAIVRPKPTPRLLAPEGWRKQ